MKFKTVILSMAVVVGASTSLSAQNFFDQLKNNVQNEINNAINGGQRRPQQPPQPRPSFQSVPSESGKKNIGNPGWGGGGDFVIQPQPVPRPNPGTRPYQPPQYVQPYPQPQPQYGQPYPSNQHVYVQPQQQSQPWVSNSGSSVVYGQSTSYSVPGPPVSVANTVRIHCTESSQGSCPYTLISSYGEYPFSISAGQEQRFDLNTTWKIRLKAAGKMKTFNLKGGKLYRLKRDNSGWQLYVSD